jgi:hypothetical protein
LNLASPRLQGLADTRGKNELHYDTIKALFA